MRSDALKKRAPILSLLHATGISQSEMGKPFIGLASSFTDLVPGHVDMRSLERVIEKGSTPAAGFPSLLACPRSATGSPWGTTGCTIPSLRAN